MVQAHKKLDPLTLTLITGVAALHLWALSPMKWMNHLLAQDDEMEVEIELAANQPMARAGATAEATPPNKTPVVSNRNADTKAQAEAIQTVTPSTNATANDVPVAAPAAAQTSNNPAPVSVPASPGADIPSTNASYEVGSLKNPRPAYPPGAFLSRTEGRVVLKVHVMPDGKPAEIQLVQSSGSAQLDKSAMDTLAKWELQPARKNGEPIEQWIQIPIHFRVLQK